MNPQEHQQVDELIASVMQDRVPEDVQRQMRGQLSQLRSRLVEAGGQAVSRPVASGGAVWSGVAATVAATLVLALVLAWSLRPGLSFADVAAAALQQPWIHVTTTEPNGETNETWYSPARDVSGWRHRNWIEFRDHRLKVYYSYDAAEEVLYRVPEYTPRRAGSDAAMAAVLPLLLAGGELVDNPLERMNFLGPHRAKMKLVEQKLRRVQEGDREWLEFDLTVHYQDEPLRMLFRVDPDTKLPRVCRFEGRWKGEQLVSEKRFEYPETGPKDVYALGVPVTARLVDRVPSDDLERILKSIQAGRQRMDAYRAIVVTLQPDGYDWWNEQPLLLYRKGDRFRADKALARGELRKVKQPAEGADMDAWWRRRADDFSYYPVYMVRRELNDPSGALVEYFHFDHRFVTAEDGSTRVEIESVKGWEAQSDPGDEFPPYWSRRPEFICRPPMGLPSQTMEPVLELEPASGPANSVLLRVRASGRMPQAAPRAGDRELPPQPDAFRYWLDPARDYAVVRWDQLRTGEQGEEEMSSTVVEKLARSPHGTWYATQARITSQVPGGEAVQVVQIYLDFDADLPDALFEPPAVGLVY